MRLPNKFRKGLTLVEIAVVVFIMGILMSYVISSLKNIFRPSVADTVEKFRQSIVFCYQSALLHNQAVLLKVNLDDQKYTAYRVVRSEDGITEKKIIASSFTSNSHVREIVDIRGVVHERGEIVIPFTYTGVSEDYSFHFGDDSGTQKTLLLYRYNGKITIKDGEVTRKARNDSTKKSDFDDADEF